MNRVWLRLGLVVLVAYAVTSIGLMQTPRYEASAQMWVAWDQRTLEYRGEPPTQEIMHTIETRSVAQEAIQRLELQMDPDELLDSLTVEQIEGTQFIQFTYESTDPVKATKIVNAVGAASSELISRLIAESSAADGQLTAEVWEKAKVPDSPVSPRPVRTGLVTLVVGLTLSVLTLAPPRSLAAEAAQIADGLTNSLKFRADQALTNVRQGVVRRRLAGGRRAARREAEAIKEQELLEALGRCGKLTALEAALETSLSVDEANRMLCELAVRGHLQITVEHDRLLYSFWKADGP